MKKSQMTALMIYDTLKSFHDKKQELKSAKCALEMNLITSPPAIKEFIDTEIEKINEEITKYGQLIFERIT